MALRNNWFQNYLEKYLPSDIDLLDVSAKYDLWIVCNVDPTSIVDEWHNGHDGHTQCPMCMISEEEVMFT